MVNISIRARGIMKIWRTILWIIFCLSLSGCAAAGGAQPAAAPVVPAEVFRVALILPRAINADGWTRSGYEGLLAIQRDLGAEIAYSEAVSEAMFETEFRRYATDGYDFVIGHGTQLAPAAERVAAEFPRTAFAITGKYGGNNTNLGGLSLREGEMAYLFGVIAALKSETKHVAFLGGAENPSNQEIVALFERGVAATDPAVDVTIDWVGNFTDTLRAQEIARSQIAAGVDVILVLAGAAGTDVHEQAEEAGIFTLGWIEDLHELAPGAVLTSNVQDIPAMLLQGARLVRQGRWEGKQYKFGMAEGVQHLAPFYGLISAEEERRINSVKNDLLTGVIDPLP
jgi:basic membrane protein A